MKQKKLWIGILFCSLLVWTGNAFAAGPVFQRQDRQQQRIEKGVRNGNITRPELKQLKKEQRNIAKFKQKAKRDHHISRHEARRIKRLQDRASNNIYNYRNNKAKQPRKFRHAHNKRHNNYPAMRPHRHCSVDRYIGSSINGLIAQPGISLAWNIAFD
ncbi:MAG: hypothetical protein BA869_08770 [Desulfuromonadales bacterium C00003107]|jgi:hypothetical protein|nr:MAG: hypothetical protein BA869_08770 [Desulfuromonadales bacterium C00003107]